MKKIVCIPVCNAQVANKSKLWINLISQQVSSNQCNIRHKRKHYD